MDNDEAMKRLAFWEQLLAATFETGFTHIEAFVCEKCGQKNFMAHMGVESMVCVKCDTRRASLIPPPPSSGELQVKHYETALRLLKQVQQQQAAELPPLMAGEIAALPLPLRTMLARHRIGVVTETVQTVIGAAEELASVTRER